MSRFENYCLGNRLSGSLDKSAGPPSWEGVDRLVGGPTSKTEAFGRGYMLCTVDIEVATLVSKNVPTLSIVGCEYRLRHRH